MSSVFPRLRPATALGTLAAGGLALGIYSRLVAKSPVLADSGAPPKAFSGGPAFVSLPLESSEMVNHNTKRLRFKLPNPDAVSGLPLTCTSLPCVIFGRTRAYCCSLPLDHVLAQG